MLEIIKEQFESGKTLTKSRYYNLVNRGLWPKYYWDQYPLAQEYYHELNPYFLYNLYRPDLFKFSKTITVRDGLVTFANFLLENVSTLSKLGVGGYLVHPDLVPLIPFQHSSKFLCWRLVQKKQVTLETAKKVIIFGFASEQYLGNMDNLKERLRHLDEIRTTAPVEIYLPQRKNVFAKENNKELLTIHHVVSDLKDVLKNREIRFITGEYFFDITDFKDTYIYDLAPDNFMVTDNYLHYYVQSRGASVNNNTLLAAPENSMFSFDLSLYHEFHVVPLPKTENIFVDLLFYKKQNPFQKELLLDPQFHALIRKTKK